MRQQSSYERFKDTEPFQNIDTIFRNMISCLAVQLLFSRYIRLFLRLQQYEERKKQPRYGLNEVE